MTIIKVPNLNKN